MTFQWPDPISFVADAVTIVGIPLLIIAFRTILKERKYEREHNTVSMGCLEFYDVEHRWGVNLVPLKMITGVPRVGDKVYLPGETHDEENRGSGYYSVLNVIFGYEEDQEIDQPCPARPVKITVDVRRVDGR